MSPAGKAAIGVGAIVVVVGLFIVLRDEGEDSGETTTPVASESAEQSATTSDGAEPKAEDEPTPQEQESQESAAPAEPEVPVITVKNGEPAGGVAELSFKAGDRIRFVVESDIDEEIHFHGYDITKDVSAGGKVEFDVPATIEGVFEVELHHLVVPIAEISVNPA